MNKNNSNDRQISIKWCVLLFISACSHLRTTIRLANAFFYYILHAREILFFIWLGAKFNGVAELGSSSIFQNEFAKVMENMPKITKWRDRTDSSVEMNHLQSGWLRLNFQLTKSRSFTIGSQFWYSCLSKSKRWVEVYISNQFGWSHRYVNNTTTSDWPLQLH